MKRLFLFAVIAVTMLAASAQATIEPFVHDTTSTGTNIRVEPRGKIALTLPAGSYMLTLSNPQGGWWEVKDIFEAEEGNDMTERLHGSKTGKYYIHYSVVAFATRNYGGQLYFLREKPDPKSRAILRFKEEMLLRPIDVNGEWIRVRTLDGKYDGWIHTEQLCGNPLTNCC